MGKRPRTEEDEETAFPRGGGGGEKKMAQPDESSAFPRGGGGGGVTHEQRPIKASKKKAPRMFTDEGSDGYGAAFAADGAGGSHHGGASGGGVGGSKFVEQLKYKTLRVGMKVLGVVVDVNERGLQISLPNGLKGTVTRAEASDVFAASSGGAGPHAKKTTKTKRSEEDDADEEDASSSEEEEEEDEEESEQLSLLDMFTPGQTVRCVVRQLGKGKSGGKRIDLTLKLSAVCAGIPRDALVGSGACVPACVESVEDHGCVLSFGVKHGPRGFLPRKAAPPGRVLTRGSLVDVVLTNAPGGDEKTDAGGGGNRTGAAVVTCTADPRRVAAHVTHESDGTAMATLLPGMLVNARVRAVLSDGLNVNFMTYFAATVDAFHVADAKVEKGVAHVAAPAADPARAHAAGERCRARVLYVDAAAKRVGLTLRPHLLNPPAQVGSGSGDHLPPVGAAFEDAVVARVDPNVGVLLRLPPGARSKDGTARSSACAGYAHISDVADEHVDKLERRFKVGAKVRARVVGHRALDGVATVSLKPSVLNQPFLSLDELTAGMTVHGEVVAVEPYGAVVKLAPGVKALCPPNHVSDIPGRVTNAKVREGARLKFRVLSVDHAKGRALVTHKKTLIKSELPVVADLDDATPGTVTHGVVTGVEPYGVFVQLYGNLRGLAGAQDLGLTADQTPEETFSVGQCVRATVLRADRGPGKIKLSLAPGGSIGADRPSEELDASVEDVNAPPPGTIVESATVRRVDETTGNVQVTLPGGIPGMVTAAQLSDNPLTGAALAGVFSPGDPIGPLVALEAKPRRSILSRKAALVAAARARTLPGEVGEVVVGATYPGYVASATQNAGVFVRFLGRLTGLAPPSTLADRDDGGLDPEEMFGLGQTVLARVVAVDATVVPPRLSLSLAPRDVAASNPLADATLLSSLFADVDAADALADAKESANAADGELPTLSAATAARLVPGAAVSGVVHGVREYGVLLDMPEIDPDAVGLITFHQLPTNDENSNTNEEIVDEDSAAAAGIEEGVAVAGRVLDVSRREGVVDIGARADLVRGDASDKKKKAGKGKKADKASRGGSEKTRAALEAAAGSLPVGTEVTASVELVKPEYAVLSLPDHGGAVGYAPVHHLNKRYNDPGERFVALQQVTAVVAGNQSSGSPGGRLLLTVPLEKGSSRGGEGGSEAVGEVMEGVVREVAGMQAILALPNGRRGRLHATEMPPFSLSQSPGDSTDPKRSGVSFDFPLKRLAVGATLEVTVLGPAGDRGSMLELSARRAAGEARELHAAAVAAGGGDGAGAGVAGSAALATAQEGDEISGVVTAVSAETLAVAVAPGLTVKIPRIETAASASTLKKALTSRFAIGQRISGFVLTSDAARRRMIVSLRAPEARAVKTGALLAGVVSKIAPGGGGVFVQLNSRQHGRVHVTDIEDTPGPEPWRRFKVGDAVDVRVVGTGESGEVDLSTRASDIATNGNGKKKVTGKSAASITTAASLAPGAAVSGFVKQCTKGGCFVAVSRTLDARVKLCNLSDEFVANPPAAFPKGKLVQGVVLSVDAEAGHVEMTLRSDGQDGGARSNNDAPVEVGTVQMGTVRRVQTYGVFITLDGSGRSGLCHISQFADARITDSLEAHVRVGERVRVKVLAVDEETGRVSLGMKPSLFDGDDEEGGSAGAGGKGRAKEEDPLMVDADEEEDEEMEEDEEQSDDDMDDEDMEEDDDDVEEEEEDDDDVDEESDDDEGDALQATDDSDGSASDDDEAEDMDASDDDDDDDDESESESEDGSGSEEGAAIDADVGFDWDADGAEKAAHPSDAEDGDADKKPKSKREKARAKAEKEMELHRREQALREASDRAPETAPEFEKLIMANPRSSYVWLRYMAFQMSVGAHDEAREVAERALKAIPAPEEDERMNVWVAYLNLENLHGKPTPREALLRLFDRATKVANPKKLHLTLAGIYERDGADDMATQTLKTAVRRFSQSAKVWLAYIRAAIVLTGSKSADSEQIRKALDRATQALPKRKHVKVLVQTALLEIREGSVERGRTMFESILRNYPRRTDIWSTYVDQEIKQGDPTRTRALLERATHLDLNPKSMKFLFKRYLDFERSVGDQARIEHVKTRAMEYVSSKFG